MSQSNQALAAGQVGSGEVVNAACSAARCHKPASLKKAQFPEAHTHPKKLQKRA